MHGDGWPALLFDLIAQMFEALRCHLSQLELRQLSRDGAIIDRTAHSQSAVGQFFGSGLGIAFVLEVGFRPPAERQRLG